MATAVEKKLRYKNKNGLKTGYRNIFKKRGQWGGLRM
uniref:Uncharacterized protein n=1 Tax=Anguilla anguilla TaxID=7936 RepID=A0A0E9XSQ6_ANGAN